MVGKRGRKKCSNLKKLLIKIKVGGKWKRRQKLRWKADTSKKTFLANERGKHPVETSTEVVASKIEKDKSSRGVQREFL